MLSLKIVALALAMRESDCDPNAVNGNCVGEHQIKPITVDDCNRIAGYNKYTLNDRLDPKKSEEMCLLIMHEYLPTHWTIRDAALLWREGCKGRFIHANDHDQYIKDVEQNYWKIRNAKVNSLAQKNPSSV